MRKEIVQRQTEVKNLREDLEARNYQMVLQTKEFEKKAEQVERLKVILLDF
jgi:hypothetical protein